MVTDISQIFDKLSDKIQEKELLDRQELPILIESQLNPNTANNLDCASSLLGYLDRNGQTTDWIDPNRMSSDDVIGLFIDYLKKHFISRSDYSDKNWVR